jgi:hypothetical protein
MIATMMHPVPQSNAHRVGVASTNRTDNFWHTGSAVEPVWVDRVKEGYEEDPKATQLLAELSATDGSLGAFTLTDGLIRYNGRVWLGNNGIAQQHIL